ncbi:hypothetical protein [Winogradskyella wandonensis]|nr:hypothetical protein [Winogradskyella wandonensis]
MITHQVSEATARGIIKDINAHYKLPKRPYVSLKCYCEYYMLDKADVVACLNAELRAS